MRKVCILLGSPRKNGNVAKMADIAAKEYENEGASVTTIVLYEKSLSYCSGCMKCRKDGVCKKKDDYEQIRTILLESEVIVLASPIYFANVSAAVKNFFDRFSGLAKPDHEENRLLKGKSYLLLTTCSVPPVIDRLFAHQTKRCQKAMKEFFHLAGMHSIGAVAFAGTTNKQEIPQKIQGKIRRYIG